MGPGDNTIYNGEKMISDGKGMISDGEKMISDGNGMISEGEKMISNGKRMNSELEDNKYEATSKYIADTGIRNDHTYQRRN